ncbi:piggyBac transposable element-derived protein 3, partial [Caerostris extrusa]
STLSGKNGVTAVERVRVKRSFDCHPGYFVCNSTKICVEQRFICDDYKDCEDGSDEWNCTGDNRKWGSSLYVCMSASWMSGDGMDARGIMDDLLIWSLTLSVVDDWVSFLF